jgi:hypothetical protein
MHNVSVKSSPDPFFVPASSKATFPNLPVVTVDSPPPIPSPHRSPRMSDLLFALRDVIGDDPDDPLGGTTFINDSNASRESNSTSAASLHSHEDETTVGDSGSPAMDAVNTTPADNATLCVPPESHSSRNSSPDTEHLPVYHTESTDTSDLLSPVILSQLNLTAFAQFDSTSSSKDGDSIDSGYADSWTAPQPFAKTPPRSPLYSTFDLLSSPFGPPSSRVLSPRLSAFITRPPASPFGTSLSAVDDPADLSLDSPEKESDGADVADDSPRSPSGVLETSGNPIADEDVERDHGEDTSGRGPTSPSRWDCSEDQTTAVYLGIPPLTPKEVKDAILHSNTTLTHFLTEPINFVDDEANGSFSAVSRSPSPTPSRNRDGESVDESSSKMTEREDHFQADSTGFLPAEIADEVGVDADREQNLSDSSFTAKLAYLTSPSVPLNENDTLNFIYDDYSNKRDTSTVLSINTDIVPSSETGKEPLSAKTPIASEPIRERVFTPPLVHRVRSEAVAADSPTSLPSPRIFSHAVRASRLSSYSRGTRSVWSPDSSLSDVQELPQSKKVPFGFRHSRPVVRLQSHL